MDKKPATPAVLWPVAAVAAWVFPGLGHALLGDRSRAVVFAAALILLFFGGMVIGGVDVVDRRNDTIWFAGQALIGPVALAADFAHARLDAARQRQEESYAQQHNLTTYDHDALRHMLESGVAPAYRTSVGRPNELGTLYCTMAGALNLLVILDAVRRAMSRGVGTQ